jgi:hypothetical protein
MSEHQAELLNPIDAAPLWAQSHRLGTEVVATRAGHHLLLRAAMAATGLGKLPMLPRTVVVGVRNGLNYRGVLVARRLAGGSAWEVVSLRIARDKDDDTIESLLQATAMEVAQRDGRTLFLRYAEGSPHEEPIRQGGLLVYTREQLYGPPDTPRNHTTPMRPAGRADRAAVFRLYCQAVPEVVRRHEAITQHELRALLDLFECAHEYVLDGDGAPLAWAGIGEHEARIICQGGDDADAVAALDLVRARLDPSGTLVLGEYQHREQSLATERGFMPLGMRVVSARRLAALNPLKESLAVPATSRVPN